MKNSENYRVAIFWIMIGGVILLIPAMIVGRPFIFWDTPTFYSWGHDILAAIGTPWPSLAHFPDHRGLWAADNMRGAGDQISANQFQLVMTSIGARSKFYALPFYVLGSVLGLWAMAFAQALAVSGTIWLVTAVLLGQGRPLTFITLVVTLTLGTTAPFYAAFLMPDIFAPLGIIAAALLLCFSDRMGYGGLIACAILVVTAVLVHSSNFLVLLIAIAIACSANLLWRPGDRLPMKGFAILAFAGVLSAGLGAVSDLGMRAAFGEPVRTAPFAEGRVIADGPGRTYLQEVCPQHAFAACRYKDLNVPFPDDIIWPDVSWHHLPLITEPAERRRYLDEQTAVVLGTIEHHPLAEFRAMLRNGLTGLMTFRIAESMGQSLRGLLNDKSDRTMRIMQTVPNMKPCVTGGPHACDTAHALRYVQRFQLVVLVCSALFLVWQGLSLWWSASLRRNAPLARSLAFTLFIVTAVVVNGMVCGALSGPFERYQARVVWLIPMTAVLLALQLSSYRGLSWRLWLPAFGTTRVRRRV
jgi:hypothetical protein